MRSDLVRLREWCARILSGNPVFSWISLKIAIERAQREMKSWICEHAPATVREARSLAVPAYRGKRLARCTATPPMSAVATAKGDI